MNLEIVSREEKIDQHNHFLDQLKRDKRNKFISTLNDFFKGPSINFTTNVECDAYPDKELDEILKKIIECGYICDTKMIDEYITVSISL